MHFLDVNAVNGSKQVNVSSHAPRVESVISSDRREVFTGSKGVKMLTVAAGHMTTGVFTQVSGSPGPASQLSNINWQEKTLESMSLPQSCSVGGIHCVDVAVQLVPEREPGFAGEINLRVPTQTSRSFTVAAPGCGGTQARLCFFNRNCGTDTKKSQAFKNRRFIMGHV